MRYKHWRYQRSLLIARYISMYTRSQKRIKTKMETTKGFYGKQNEIISWHLFCVGSCLVISANYCWFRYHCRNTLHQICLSWIDNDNICKNSNIVFDDNNIHHQWQYPLIFVCGEKKGVREMTLLSMGTDDMTIFRKVMWYRLLDYARLEW